MSPSCIQAEPLIIDTVAELDLGINAIADTTARSPYGSVKMNMNTICRITDVKPIDSSTIQSPYGSLKMNLGAVRDVLAIGGSRVPSDF